MVLNNANIQEAMQGKRIADRPAEEIRKAVETIMRELSVLAGYDPQLMYDQVDDLAKDLASGYPMLTLAEVKLAGKAGVTGELKGPKKPSYAAMMNWVSAYHRSSEVADTRKMRNSRKAETPRLSEEEGLRRMAVLMPRNARERWNGVRATGAFPRHCLPHVSAQIYDWLREEGVLSIPDGDKKEALAKAKAGVGMVDIPLGNLEAGRAMTSSLAKHMALEAWMRRKAAAGERLTLPGVRRIYN